MSANSMKIRCIICMSELVPKNKIDGIKARGRGEINWEGSG